MITRLLCAGFLILGASLSGCGYGTYSARVHYDYRVTHPRLVAPTSLSAPGAPGPVQINQIESPRLEGDGVVLEPTPGAKIGVVDADHAPFATPRPEPGTLIITAAGDGHIRITLPPRTYSAGFDIYAPRPARSADAQPVIHLTFEGDPKTYSEPVRWPDASKGAPAFFGVVGAGKPIATITWEPSPGSGGTGIANISVETH